MRYFISSLVGLALAGAAGTATAELRVVATVPDLAAIARDVGGDLVSVSCLSAPTQDPHFVDARPSLALDLSRAKLLVTVGVELESGWLPTLLLGSRNEAIQVGSRGYLETAQLVKLLEVPEQKVDRSMGDIHPGGNPHFLYDPRAGAQIARGIADRMAELDPDHASTYRSNAERLARDLANERSHIEAELGDLHGTKVIAYHRTLPYLASWLGFEVVAHVEPKPGIPPTPAHAAALLAQAKRDGVKFVVQEEYYADKTAELIAERSGARLVKLPGGAKLKEGEGYREITLRRAHAFLAVPEAARR